MEGEWGKTLIATKRADTITRHSGDKYANQSTSYLTLKNP